MKKMLIFDGAMGSELQKHKFSGSPEQLNLDRPELIQSIHARYIEAGADIISTNTFGANPYKLAKYNLAEKLDEIIKAAVGAARAAKEAVGSDTFIALDQGPTGKLLKPYGDTTFDEIYDAYKQVAISAAAAKVDFIILETFSQLGEMRAAFLAMKENTNIPIVCSMTFEENGRTLTGTTPAAFAATMEAMGAFAVGVNCSLGPDKLTNIVSEMRQYVDIPVLAMPNAGLPALIAGITIYDMKADSFAKHMDGLVAAGADIIGGCCGTTPEYINCLSKKRVYFENIMADRKKISRKKPVIACSARKILVLDNDIKVVGERINPTGRKIMSQSLKNEDYSVIYKEAVEQEQAGADILDINVSVPGIDEIAAMKTVITNLESIVEIPLQIDSPNPLVLEKGLRLYNGIAIINSVNAKEESMEAVLPLAKKYGACIIGLTLGKEIPKTAEERYVLADKIVSRGAEFGIPKEKFFIDCLTMAASATQEYVFETLKALQKAKENGLKTALGVSNVSYGLPERKTMNSIFLSMAIGYGLNLAIINPADDKMKEAIVSARVIMNTDKGCVKYIEWAQQKAGTDETPVAATSGKSWSLEECIIKGIKDEALIRLSERMAVEQSFEVIDNHIIPALKEVGLLYETGKTYLPQLLQSAEVVKALFEKIRQTVEIKQGKGKVVLCTVQGDIHDIGKNIVKVMLQNNGYEVIDLGCDVAPEKVREAAIKHKAQLVGLSALMTTTIPSMEKTISILQDVNCKTLVGGAVINEQCAKDIKADYYAKDAVESVKIADRVIGS